QLQRSYEPLRHPKAPGLSLAGFQLVVALTTTGGFPGCVRFPCVHAVATTPAQRLGVLLRSFTPSRVSLPRKGCRVGLRIVLFEACSAFTRVTACTLALSPIRDTLSEGFSHFVTPIAAPAASGWSVAGWDSHPLESAALSRRTPISDIRVGRAPGSRSDFSRYRRLHVPGRLDSNTHQMTEQGDNLLATRRRQGRPCQGGDVLAQMMGIAGTEQHDIYTGFVAYEAIGRVDDRAGTPLVNQEAQRVGQIAQPFRQQSVRRQRP